MIIMIKYVILKNLNNYNLSLVPIIPAFLYDLHHQKDMVALNETFRTSTESTAMQLKNKFDEPNKYKSEFLPNSRFALEDKRPSNEVI
jgi:hypothetical protein